MTAMRGERFHIDLDDDVSPDQQVPSSTINAVGLVGDIVERNSSSAKPPSEPAPKSGSAMSGWPAHKKRYQKSTDHPTLPQRQKSFSIEDTSFDALQRQQIDAENRRRISEMAPDDIEQERKDLFENLSPGLIAKLLARSNIDDEDQATGGALAIDETHEHGRRRSSGSSRKVSFALPDGENLTRKPSAESHSLPLAKPPSLEEIDENSASRPLQPRRLSSNARKVSFKTPEPIELDDKKSTAASHSLPPTPPPTDNSTPDLPSPRKISLGDRKVSFADPEDENEENRPTAESHSLPPTPSSDPVPDFDLVQADNVHFPKPPAVPDLDPSSETFLDDLHNKYFPTLAHDPSKLEWMKPSEEGENASYDPAATHVLPEAIRFDFKGKLIPPSVAMSLPTNTGLHHHGDAPDAAGYTISELGTLSRSAFPAQRCIAIQTIGRILYRLGQGEFGDEVNRGKKGRLGEGAILTQGLWDEVEKARITDTLAEWANKTTGHQTSIALAQEAVWNWKQGGGRRLQT